MQARDTVLPKLLGRTDETGMVADVDERSARPQHATGFAHRGGEIVEICVGERRDRGVERLVGQRQSSGIGKDQVRLRMTLLGDTELITRSIDADEPPTERRRDVQEVSAATPDVETGTTPTSKQPP